MFNYETLFFNFYIISRKNIFLFIKRFLEPIQPGVGSSSATKTLQSLDAGGHIVARVLFTSPSSTPNLDRSHDTQRQTSTHWSESRYGGRDEASDVVDMVAFPGSRPVTSTGPLTCTFWVDDNELPLKQSRLLGSFNSYVNHLMFSISYTNHLDY
jgi:hypothetical protein